MALRGPEDEGPWSSLRAYAEDALAAVAYALRVQQNGDSQEAAWAARRVYEALDHFIIDERGIDTNEAGSEKLIIENPLILQELLQQKADLDDLSILAHRREWRMDIARLREKADVRPYYVLTS